MKDAKTRRVEYLENLVDTVGAVFDKFMNAEGSNEGDDKLVRIHAALQVTSTLSAYFRARASELGVPADIIEQTVELSTQRAKTVFEFIRNEKLN